MAGSRHKGRVILLGWDAADWDLAQALMAQGLLPCLSSLVKRGASGYLASYPPYLSPMLWATIATGHAPDRHGVHGFAEIDPATKRARPITSASRRTKAVWNILSGQGHACGVVGWLGSHPAEPIHGVFVADSFARAPKQVKAPWPVAAGAVFPPELAADLGELRARANDLDANLLGLLLPHLKEINTAVDQRPAEILWRLAELYTLHNAAIAILDEDKPAFLALYLHFLDALGHSFMPFHPPRMEGVSERDFRFYQDVITGAYRLLDVLLGDLLRHAGSDATVVLVSDHGFAHGANRPRETPRVAAGIAAWHQPQGLFLAAGPDIKPESVPLGARLMDIAPTLLALFDLPAGDDMPGRVLNEILKRPPSKHNRVPSWETEADKTQPPAQTEGVAGTDDLLLRQFIELGYLDANAVHSPDASTLVERQNQWNLGLALFELNRATDALPLLEQCHWTEPESPQYAFHLARCQMELALTEEAEATMQTLLDYGEEQPKTLLLRAQVLVAGRQNEKALRLLERLRGGPDDSLERRWLVRTALLQLRRYNEAARSFEEEVKRHPKYYLAWLGLANARFHTGDFTGAAEAARATVALQPRLPAGHAILMQSLEKLGQTDDASTALEHMRRVFPRQTLEEERQFFAPPDAETALDRRLETEGNRVASILALREAAAQRLSGFLEERRHRRGQSEPRRFAQPAAQTDKKEDFYAIVSGVPRSGTSLMMRLLSFGGLPVLTDGIRVPDDDNPLGYFEWDDAKRLAVNPTSISAAAGKAVKIVSPLLPHLPSDRSYHVIFMRRPGVEMANSQASMLARSGKGSALAPEALAAQLEKHVAETLAWLRSAAYVHLLEVPFSGLIENTDEWINRIVAFIGPARLPRPDSMARAIQRNLWRQGSPAPSSHA